ncbi:hypothetical protein R2B67_35755 [Streptomyces cyaneofuscatus]|uniref:hypothetical protein n=1 Tax=Streptomyces cyaneofuscatus TaxID=66883 RepID=UPI002955B39A|nr:hypothetical protein [Streptomyces cyaneofuscatus]WOP13572.1 hypothetical protein R2B67_35755 [Streptomyces cyaneofuscatus]
MPGKVADYLRTTGLEPVERAALDQGVAVRREGYALRVSAIPAVHRQLLAAASRSTAARTSPRSRQRKARREYENRVSALTP